MKNFLKNYKQILFVIFLANLFLLNACNSPETANTNQQNRSATGENDKKNPASDNIDELLNLVQLPEVPEEVVWREEPLSDNRENKRIIAVLQYTPENAAKLVALIEKNKQQEQVEVGTENWFPGELTAQAQMSGNEMLKGTAYGANQFYNIPYGNGRITRIENTNYFVLELTTN